MVRTKKVAVKARAPKPDKKSAPKPSTQKNRLVQRVEPAVAEDDSDDEPSDSDGEEIEVDQSVDEEGSDEEEDTDESDVEQPPNDSDRDDDGVNVDDNTSDEDEDEDDDDDDDDDDGDEDDEDDDEDDSDVEPDVVTRREAMALESSVTMRYGGEPEYSDDDDEEGEGEEEGEEDDDDDDADEGEDDEEEDSEEEGDEDKDSEDEGMAGSAGAGAEMVDNGDHPVHLTLGVPFASVQKFLVTDEMGKTLSFAVADGDLAESATNVHGDRRFTAKSRDPAVAAKVVASPGDIEKTCKDCACKFAFSVEEQDFFAKKGFDPATMVRCPECRAAKKAKRTSEAGRSGGRGCFVCGSMDHMARDCPDGESSDRKRKHGTKQVTEPSEGGILKTCKECQSTFEFTAEEQDFFTSKGFDHSTMVRCSDCRAAKKARMGGGRGRGSGRSRGRGGGGRSSWRGRGRA
mmetsp:Transcript_7377/g.18951  ORF Transcript_7377/g.18951 Transcript_7377/m.18951 type:complete len:459 (-) Transcript_7377:141-1517(-)